MFAIKTHLIIFQVMVINSDCAQPQISRIRQRLARLVRVSCLIFELFFDFSVGSLEMGVALPKKPNICPPTRVSVQFLTSFPVRGENLGL